MHSLKFGQIMLRKFIALLSDRAISGGVKRASYCIVHSLGNDFVLQRCKSHSTPTSLVVA